MSRLSETEMPNTERSEEIIPRINTQEINKFVDEIQKSPGNLKKARLPYNECAVFKKSRTGAHPFSPIR
jgi:hypothetical protein